ncbi:MAG TPA: alpha-amylase family glycosyl hydrolase [Treponemataceae bacterium]|nr:alpha-amylase family glycosyl hydrolase [Treponemataceae bacterium]
MLASLTGCPGATNPDSEANLPPSPVGFPAPPANLYDYVLLGASYATGDTVEFSLFAPRATEVLLVVKGKAGSSMTKDAQGIWRLECTATPPGTHYRFKVDGRFASDPYGKAWSWEDNSNGGWSIVVNPEYTWNDSAWSIPTIEDLVIYEMHLKDFSSHDSSSENSVQATNKGKYAGLTDSIPYLTELGINAIELMPISEFNDGGYSWGYNTQSFFAPESGFSVAREKGYPTGAQVKEFQELVDNMHQNEIAVIVDMVYNHVGNDQNAFWAIDNIYYFDYNNNGTVSDDGTPWGNHVATWRPMVKKLMYDNLRYFAQELHVDGFRFDATSFMDHDALKEVVAALKNEFSDLIFIAEQLPNSESFKSTGMAQWSDLFHDTMKAMLRMGPFEGSTYGDVGQVATMTYYSRDQNWSANPKETINYFESHDENSILFEVLTKSGNTEVDALKATKLGALNLFTALGTPMIMAGQEFLRDREGQNLDESNGQIDWSWKTATTAEAVRSQNAFAYYKGLINLRITHPSLRMVHADPATSGAFRWSVVPTAWGDLGYPVTKKGSQILGYALNVDGALGTGSTRWVVVLNYSTTNANNLSISFPCAGVWKVVANDSKVKSDGTLGTVTAAGSAEDGWFANYDLPERSGLIFAHGL